MNETYTQWLGKIAILEFFKDGKKLVFYATILDYNPQIITFKDKYGKTYAFSSTFVTQITDKSDGE